MLGLSVDYLANRVCFGDWLPFLVFFGPCFVLLSLQWGLRDFALLECYENIFSWTFPVVCQVSVESPAYLRRQCVSVRKYFSMRIIRCFQNLRMGPCPDLGRAARFPGETSRQ